MATKKMSQLHSIGGQISLHSMHGRFLQKMAPSDNPAFFVNGGLSALHAAGGEIQLQSRHGRFLQKTAIFAVDSSQFRIVEGEVSLRTPYGDFLQPGLDT